MEFRVVDPIEPRRDVDTLYLVRDNWDDWFQFETQFNLYYVDSNGRSHHIGQTKIGRFDLKGARASADPAAGYRRPDPPLQFDQLPADFFSLGQDTTYYEALSEIGEQFRDRVLAGLRDIAYDRELLNRANEEAVTRVSLLRHVPLLTVREQFSRLAKGGVKLTPYAFTFRQPNKDAEPLVLDFSVQPDSVPPTNIHVFIGRNGVGKSTLLHTLSLAVVKHFKISEDEASDSATKSLPNFDVSNLVSVSFSAFDAFEPITQSRDRGKGLSYHYVGLKKIAKAESGGDTTKDPAALSREMTTSAKACLQGTGSRARWIRALRLLEADPIFASVGLADLIEEGVDEEFLARLPELFRNLSSGHKVVLLTVTRLVETVVEKSLVLLDEPEAHLHPPLLSAFVRALSDLLTNRNGMAIVATHSPVVLQEVPRSCVWKLHRWGYVIQGSRPDIETFGENVGVLTDEVFGLEVTSTGFHKLLTEAAQEFGSYEEALASFGGQLGSDARAILRSRIASRMRPT